MKGLNSPRLLILLALLSVLLGRGLSRGLPGVLSGFDAELVQLIRLGATLSQFSALIFIAVATRLTVLVLVARTTPLAFKIVAAGACGSVTLVGFWSALNLEGNVGVAFTSVAATLVLLAAVSSGCLALRQVERRAASLLCLGFAAAAVLHLNARWLALAAYDTVNHPLYFSSRLLATGGNLLELFTLCALFYWLLNASQIWLRVAAVVAIVCAPALALGAESDGTLALALRDTLAQLTAHPDPLFPRWAGRSIELWALLGVAYATVALRLRASLAFVVAMSALSRSSVDIPLYGVFLLTAALALHLPQFGQEPADQPLR